jgi:flagellar hook assembly protein FlgD
MTGLTDNFIAIPERYELGQNYPNPFNPKTTISYALPEDAYVDIGIYNVAGQKVRTLVSEEQDAGYKKVIWDSRDDSGKAVTSGVYIYRMKAGVFKETKRLVLLK